MSAIFIILFTLFSGIGFFLIAKPALVIEIQRRFYVKINWKLEPISMPKEIRNTRLMGFIVIILWLIALIIYFIIAMGTYIF